MASGEHSGVWLSRAAGGREGGRKTRVLIVDDHPQYRQDINSILETEPDLEPVGEASSGAEALEQVGRLRPHIVLMDVNMPGMDGIETTRKLVESYPDVGVIMLTMHTSEAHLREARRAGASAFVLKDASSEVLLKTIRDVVLGEMPLLHDTPAPPGVTAENATQPYSPTTPANLLSANERAVLKLLAAGRTNDQIAREVGTNGLMVRTYLEEIYRKLGLSGRDTAIQYARQHGLG